MIVMLTYVCYAGHNNSMMGLVMKEDIILNRPNGDKSYIQLLFGDITQLQLEDAVDFLFVSAFPGTHLFIKMEYIYTYIYVYVSNVC